MANGQQLAADNLRKFHAWVMERHKASDWIDYIFGGQLNRSEIAKECEFSVSALRQNPSIREALTELENKLRLDGILHEHSPSSDQRALQKRVNLSSTLDRERIKSLEEKNAALTAEVYALKETLKRYELLDMHLAETGRLIKP